MNGNLRSGRAIPFDARCTNTVTKGGVLESQVRAGWMPEAEISNPQGRATPSRGEALPPLGSMWLVRERPGDMYVRGPPNIVGLEHSLLEDAPERS